MVFRYFLVQGEKIERERKEKEKKKKNNFIRFKYKCTYPS